MNALARDKITIFDRNLPRIAMRLVHLRRYHAKMLRRFASCPSFNSEQLTVRIKAREGSRTYEFSGLTGFLDYLRDPQNDTPDALELSYQYAKVVHLPGGASDVAIMNSSVLFGEAGRNECYITSNDEKWANDMHAFIKQDLARYKIPNWGRIIKNTAFFIAAASLIVFGMKFFPFSSNESFITMVAFFASAIIVAWPTTYFPFKQIANNRILLQ